MLRDSLRERAVMAWLRMQCILGGHLWDCMRPSGQMHESCFCWRCCVDHQH